MFFLLTMLHLKCGRRKKTEHAGEAVLHLLDQLFLKNMTKGFKGYILLKSNSKAAASIDSRPNASDLSTAFLSQVWNKFFKEIKAIFHFQLLIKTRPSFLVPRGDLTFKIRDVTLLILFDRVMAVCCQQV